ncbi:MAG: hypothetical protein HW411_1150 [Gammaproteobacteria bacterium]|nr:hypothetical protein [Gammaproteobacteria bacterium]
MICCLILTGVFVPVQAVEIGTPYEFSETRTPGDIFMSIRLLGALQLSADKVNGFSARELSGLAWDEDEQILYAVSDDGFVAHLAPGFTGEVLTGTGFVRGDTVLVIGLEFPPRIERFRPDGGFIDNLVLPDYLADRSSYHDKESTIDALTFHASYGFIVAPQRPLVDIPPGYSGIYATDGNKWLYDALNNNSHTLGLETMPDGDLLVLERIYSSFFKPVTYALRKLNMDDIDGNIIPVSEVAHFSNHEGWAIDNFEGIARHRGNRYFMVSDDNESIIQKTLLIYFEIVSDNGQVQEPDTVLNTP